MTNFHPLQPFRVHSHSDLSHLQRQSLIQLYQPLVGVRAVGFYFTLLYQLPETPTRSVKLLHSRLLEQTNLGLHDLKQARLALEAVGLLRTYRREEEGVEEDKQEIIYDLLLPLEAQEFFAHPLYSTALFRLVGDEVYEQLLQNYESDALIDDSCQELTRSFEEVFQVRSQESYQETQEAAQGRHFRQQYDPEAGDQSVESESFDYSRFLRYLLTENINHQELTQGFKEQVLSLHQLYDLDEATLVEVTRLAYNPLSKHIETSQLKRIAAQRAKKRQARAQASNQVDFPYDYSPSELKERKAELAEYNTNFSESDLEIIVTTEQIPVALFLEMTKKSKGGFATSSEKYFVRELQKVSQLPPAVINLLIYYLLVIQERENLFRQELDRVANQWQQEGLKTPEAALSHIQQQERIQSIRRQTDQKRRSNRPYYQSAPRQETIPSWMKEANQTVETPPSESGSESQEDETLAQRVQDQLQELYQKGRQDS